MKVIEGGITAVKGFQASAVNCGIKKIKPDLALIYSEVPAIACGMFTQNKIQAAPVKVTKEHLMKMTTQAVIVNSGNANCCTGKKGHVDALAMTEAVAKNFGLEKDDVLVASTGVIGRHLPITKIKTHIPQLIKGLSNKAGHKVAQAIMTTDKTTKEIAVEVKLKKRTIRIGAVAKGAGMIDPNMATMLCFITTDAHITRRALKIALKNAVDKSFNAISVDGDMSTNDSVIAMANGASGPELIDKNKEDFKKFSEALDFITEDLAKKIVKDGEGATKFVELLVKGAASDSGAKRTARKIANSLLFKTALFGHDPNWGRIAASAGASGAKFNSDKIDIFLGTKRVLKDGAALEVDKAATKDIFKKKDIKITVDLKTGKREYRMWTTDISIEYVKINSHYST